MKIPQPFRFLTEVNFAGFVMLASFVIIGTILRSIFHWITK